MDPYPVAHPSPMWELQGWPWSGASPSLLCLCLSPYGQMPRVGRYLDRRMVSGRSRDPIAASDNGRHVGQELRAEAVSYLKRACRKSPPPFLFLWVLFHAGRGSAVAAALARSHPRQRTEKPARRPPKGPAFEPMCFLFV